MTIERLARICFCVVFTPALAAGQAQNDAPGQAAPPASKVLERTYPSGDAPPWRRVQTRSVSGVREVVVDTSEVRSIEGRLAPREEVVVETIRNAPNSVSTRRDLYGFGGDQRRRLLETTESVRENLANGDTSVVETTLAPDLNGRLAVTSQLVERTRTGAEVQVTETTRLVPSVDATLEEAERTEFVERRVTPGVARYDSTHLIRDINGRWQSVEIRRGEAREIGAAERTEEETIERRDVNGRLVVDERNVVRRTTTNGRDDETIETYGGYVDGVARFDNSLTLNQRIHRTTTTAADGREHSVEEVEARSLANPSDPMRLVRRTVTAVRPAGIGRWVTERQVFERDVNGRLQLVISDTEETAGQN